MNHHHHHHQHIISTQTIEVILQVNQRAQPQIDLFLEDLILDMFDNAGGHERRTMLGS